MFAFWPNDVNPELLVFCIEGSREELGTTLPGSAGLPKYNPSVQRVDVKTGEVETVLRGMSRCDGIRRTSWGTILATEETGDGQAYELLPTSAINLTVMNRSLPGGTPGAIVDGDGNDVSHLVVKRDALPTMGWEGLDVSPEGVVIGGDELRPGSGTLDSDGGAIFKFVPAFAANGQIDDLALSPLASGAVYAFQASCRESTSSSFPQYGQGCEIGQGAWVKVNPATAPSDADAAGATGFYRPEDGHFDPKYVGEGYRFCWTNTGREAAQNYGEVVCMIDENPMGTGEIQDARTGFLYLADASETRGYAVSTANRFIEGDAELNSVDNLAFQPSTGNMYIIEDHSNGDIFSCLPDGNDRDIKTDGCVRVLSVKDTSAEPTGFEFTADGKTAYVAIQHSDDSACTAGTDCAMFDDYPTDDIVVVTGFKH